MGDYTLTTSNEWFDCSSTICNFQHYYIYSMYRNYSEN